MPGKLLRSVLIGLLVGGLLLALMPSLRQWQLAPTTQNDTADDSPASYNAAVRRAAPAVVNVYNRALNSTSHNQLTLGSGVIMDQRGYILTNKHVINDADQIIVALQDGRVFEALLVGSDSLTDLAVLKINATGGLPVIPINRNARRTSATWCWRLATLITWVRPSPRGSSAPQGALASIRPAARTSCRLTPRSTTVTPAGRW